jgi:hypothetical protein
MAEAENPNAVTLDDLKERARALGVPIADDQWVGVQPMIGQALEALRSLQDIDLKPLEPSVVFRAAEIPIVR